MILSISILLITLLACDVNNIPNQLKFEESGDKNKYGFKSSYKISNVSYAGPLEEVSLNNLPEHKDIKKLMMALCPLKEYPSNLCNFSKLRDLFITNCDFETISPDIKNLENLKLLTINSNRELKEIPKEVGYLTNLEAFSLRFTRITKLPKTIGNLSRLKSMLLGYNKLTQLPPEIGKLENLETLNLTKNEIRNFPNEFWNLSNLKNLDLVENQLRTIPREIKNLTKLRSLSLNDNELEEIPEEIKYLESLQILDLNNNKLTKVPDSIKRLKKLILLNLRNNKISKQEIESIRSLMPKCEILI